MRELMAWMVRCEQPDNIAINQEEYIDTRWYNWLKTCPKGMAIPESELKNEE